MRTKTNTSLLAPSVAQGGTMQTTIRVFALLMLMMLTTNKAVWAQTFSTNTTLSSTVTLNNVIVNPGVILTISPSATITITGTSQFNGTVIVDGNLIFSSGSSLTVAATTGTLTVSSTFSSTGTLNTSAASSVNINGTYNHARDGGTIPLANWNPASNCNITGMTSTSVAGFGQTFGNFTWNGASQTAAQTADGDLVAFGNISITTMIPGFSFNLGFNLAVKGNFTISGILNQPTGTATFNGSSPQTITGNQTFNNLVIDTFTASNTVTLQGPTTGITVSGTLTITKGVLAFGTNFRNVTINNLSGASTGTIDMSGAAGHSLNIGGAVTFSGTLNTGTNSSGITYSGVSSQTVFPSPNYKNLIISGAGGTKTIDASITVNENLTIGTTSSLQLFNATTPPTLTVKGNCTNGGTFALTTGTVIFNGGNFTNNSTFIAGTGTVIFNGVNISQAIGGTSSVSFNNLTINKTGTSQSLTIVASITITNTLTLTSGRIVLGANNLVFSGTTVTANGGWVDTAGGGAFVRTLAGLGTLFPVGDATRYLPVTLGNNIANASVTFNTTPTIAVPAGIGSWVINNPTILSTDITIGIPNAITSARIGFLNASTWVDVISTTGANPYTITGQAFATSAREFAVYAPLAGNDYYSTGLGTGNWGDNNPTTGTWSQNNVTFASCGCIPINTSNVTIRTGHTITLNAGATIATLTINSGGTLNTLSSLTITGATNIVGTFDDQSPTSPSTTYIFKDLTVQTGGIFKVSSTAGATYNFIGNIVNAGSFTMANGSPIWSLGNATGMTVTNQSSSTMSFSHPNNGTGAIVGDVTILDSAGGGNVVLYSNNGIAITGGKTLTNNLGVVTNFSGRRLLIDNGNSITPASSGGTIKNNKVLEYSILNFAALPTVYDFLTVGNVVVFNNANIMGVTYNDIVIGASGNALAGNITVNGNLTINASSSLSAGMYNINIKGNWIRNGAFNAVTGTVTFNGGGTTAQTITGTTTFNNLVLDNFNTLTLNNDITVSSTLTLTSGVLIVGNNQLTINNDVVATGSSFSFSKFIMTGTTGQISRTNANVGVGNNFFPIGTVNSYNPVTISGLVSGSVSVRLRPETTTEVAPFPAAQRIPYIWTITTSVATTANIQFEWNIDNGTVTTSAANVKVQRLNGGTAWVEEVSSTAFVPFIPATPPATPTNGNISATLAFTTNISAQFAVFATPAALPVPKTDIQFVPNPNNVNFSWERVTTATGYEVRIGTIDGNSSNITWKTPIAVAIPAGNPPRISFINNNIEYDVTTYYSVRATNVPSLPSNWSSVVNIFISSINNLATATNADLNTAITISPNPTKDSFIIDKVNTVFTDNHITFILMDMTGKAILTETTTQGLPYKMSLENVAKGLYFVKITNKENIVIKKIIKE